LEVAEGSPSAEVRRVRLGDGRPIVWSFVPGRDLLGMLGCCLTDRSELLEAITDSA
jgi:hypothetical protein